MAGLAKDYLSTGTADYTTTQFSVKPKDVMFETGTFRQKAVRYDDGTVQVLSRSDTPDFFFRLVWPTVTVADAKTIFDFYFDTNKGKGHARTFEFPHPIDGNTYIVRFWSGMERSIRYLQGISEITLKVEAYKAIA